MKDIFEPLSEIKRVNVTRDLYPDIEQRYKRMLKQRISPMWAGSIAACLLAILSFEVVLITQKPIQKDNELYCLLNLPDNMMYHE